MCVKMARSASKPTNVSRKTLFIRAGVHFNLFCARRRLFFICIVVRRTPRDRGKLQASHTDRQ